jgi:hypothetical protein
MWWKVKTIKPSTNLICKNEEEESTKRMSMFREQNALKKMH